MPELHKNQIQWQAPEPYKANFDKPNYSPLADALGNLGEMSDNLARTMEHYLNNKMLKDLNNVNEETNDAFEKEDSLNGNYDAVANRAIKSWEDTYNSFDEATKERFDRANPHALEEFSIGVKAKAIKKRNEQIYNHTKLDIAQWSTEVVTAPEELQDTVLKEKRKQIQDLGLPIEMTDNLLFALQDEVDHYQLPNAIANGNYKRAKYLLEKALPTFGAAERAQGWQQLQNKMKADSYEEAERQRLLAEAKEQGKDKDSALILRMHQQMLMNNDTEAADKLRLNYYYGKDIEIPDENGRIVGVIHSADTDPIIRDKLFQNMLTSSKRAPFNNEYRAQYLADFNRLASGLMKSDGSLDLDEDEFVSPEQYALAYDLRKRNNGWNTLEKDQQVFVDNVLRAYGTRAGLDIIDLNPRTQLKATSYLGVDYQKANPVVNYRALLNIYDTPAGAITSALAGDKQLTGREADTVSYYANKYEEEKFRGNYEITKGTRSDALATMFTLIATNNNPYGMQDVGLGMVPRENFESNMVRYMVEMKQRGYYDTDAKYEDLVQDFKNVYKMTTGVDYVPPKDTNPLQKYAILTMQARTRTGMDKGVAETYRNKLPKDSRWESELERGIPSATAVTNEYEETLYKDNRAATLEKDRMRAKKLEKDEVSTYEPVKPAIKEGKTYDLRPYKKGGEASSRYIQAILGENDFSNEVL